MQKVYLKLLELAENLIINRVVVCVMICGVGN